MDISKLPPPSSPEARFINPERERSSQGQRWTREEMAYNVAVSAARRARGEEPAIAPKAATPRANGWKRQFDLLK